MSDFLLSARDGNLAIVADLTTIVSFSAVMRLNGQGSWQLTMPLSAAGAEHLLAPGGKGNIGIVLRRDDVTVLSGSLTDASIIETETGALLEASGVDDTGRLAGFVALPVTDGPGYTDAYQDHQIATAERLLHHYVDHNAGPQARVDRQIPGLAMGTDSGRGPVLNVFARFDPLIDWLRGIALQGGLRFQVRQSDTVANRINFETTQPADKRGDITFGVGLGSVRSVKATDASATVNYVIVGGDGEGTAQVFAEGANNDSLTREIRWELYRDQRTAADAAVLDQTVSEELAKAIGGVTVELDPISDDAGFGRDWDLGDRVRVLTLAGEVDGYVSAVSIDMDADLGVSIAPTITPVAISSEDLTPARRTARQANWLARSTFQPTVGMGLLWLGDIAGLPSGWQVADGSSGSPDFRGYYLVAAGNQPALSVTYGYGDTIGSNSISLGNHSHTVNDQHSHTVNDQHSHTTDIDHDHASFNTANNINNATVQSGTGASATAANHNHAADPPALGTTSKTSSNAGSTTTATTNAGSTTTATTGVSGGTFDNRPAGKAAWLVYRIGGG